MKQTLFKRFTVSGIFCVLLMSLFLPPISAAATTPTLTAETVRAEKNGTVEVNISLEGNPGLWGLRFKVGYDHEALTLQRADAGNIFTSDEITLPPDLEQESYLFMADRAELANTTKKGVLAKLTFEVKSSANLTDYPITLNLVDAINVEGDEVPLTCIDGKITVANCLHGGERPVVNAKEATQTEEGYTGDIKCSICGEVLESGTVIPKLTIKPVTEPDSDNKSTDNNVDSGMSSETSNSTAKPSASKAPQTRDDAPVLTVIFVLFLSGAVVMKSSKKNMVQN